MEKSKRSKFYVYWIEFEMQDGSIKNATFNYDWKHKQFYIDNKNAIGKFFFYGDWFDFETNQPRKLNFYFGKYARRNTKTYSGYIQYWLDEDKKMFQKKLKSSLKNYPDIKKAIIRYGRANSDRVPFKSDVKVIDRFRLNKKTRIGFCSNVFREIPNRSEVNQAFTLIKES